MLFSIGPLSICTPSNSVEGFPFLHTSPGNLPDPRIKPGSPVLQADTLQSEPPKDGDTLYSQQKQDWKLTVDQIMNSLLHNLDLN